MAGGNIFAQMDEQQGVTPPPPSGNVFADMDTADNPKAPEGARTGILSNFRAGVTGGLTSLAGAIPETIDTMLHPVETAVRVGRQLVTQKPQTRPFDPDLATRAINANLGSENPENVIAMTPAERVARGAGAGLTAAVAPEAEGMTVGKMLFNATVGASAGAGGEEAAEFVPEPLKPVARVVGGLVTGLVTGGTMAATRTGAGIAADAAAPIRAGFGKAIPEGASPAETAAANPTASTLAAQKLSNRATDVKSVREMLENGPQEIVPGSQPTTFQQTGDVGLGALEREVATKAPDQFATRRGEQNIARLEALQDVQKGGDPNAVAQALKSQFDDLDKITQDHVDNLVESATKARASLEGRQESDLSGLTERVMKSRESLEAKNAASVAGLTAKAQNKANLIGGHATPDEYGEQVRTAIQTADDAERAREKGLWQAVDPHGDLTGNVVETRTAAEDVAKSLPKTAKPMSGEEAAIFDAAKDLPDLAPVQDLIALRSRVSTEMRNELFANGRSPSYARLTQLRGAIQSNLQNTISHQIVNEAKSVSRGTLAEEDTTLAKLREWQNDFYAKREAAGDVGAATARAPAEGATTRTAPDDGTVVPPTGGSEGSAGPEGLPGNAPTFDEAGVARLATATASTKQRARTFGMNPIGPVIAKAGASDLYKIPEAKVPQRFFHPGQHGFSDMQALYKSIGIDRAIPIIQDYAALSLRRAAMREDGTLDPVKYQQWTSRHADSLRALPADVAAKFGAAARATNELRTTTKAGEQALKENISQSTKTVAQAQAAAKAELKAHIATAEKTISEANRAREQTLKQAQSGALGKLIGAPDAESVTRFVGGILGKPTAAADMKQLASAVEKDPLAKDGLRQAVADHIANKLISNTEAGASGRTLIKADQFQTFVKQNRQALSAVFTPAEMKNIEAIAADIQRAKRSENAVKLPGGSNTAQDLTGIRANDKKSSSLFKLALDALGAQVGGAVGFIAAHITQQMREAGIDRVDQLVTKAMLDPRLARELLKKVPEKPTGGSALTIGRALRASAIGTTIATMEAKNQK